jgi:hypothetical protein
MNVRSVSPLVVCFGLLVLNQNTLLGQTSVPLTNPGFEDAVGYGGELPGDGSIVNFATTPGWSAQADPASELPNFSGADNNQPTIPAGSNFGYIGIEAAIFTAASFRPAAIVGNTYTATIAARDDVYDGNSVNVAFSLEFYDANSVLLASFTNNAVLGSVNSAAALYSTLSVVGTSPVGAATVGIRFQTTSTTVLDQATLSTSAIPEPASAALLVGLAGLALHATRRRR